MSDSTLEASNAKKRTSYNPKGTFSQSFMTITDYISTGLKHSTAIHKPSFGIKGYNVPDQREKDKFYKINNI